MAKYLQESDVKAAVERAMLGCGRREGTFEEAVAMVFYELEKVQGVEMGRCEHCGSLGDEEDLSLDGYCDDCW